MMRVARQPREEANAAAFGSRLRAASRALWAIPRLANAAALACLAVILGAAPDRAGAQTFGGQTSFAKTPGGMFGERQKLDKAQPLYLQGDQLIYDTKGNRVIARGNVEIYYNNNVLTGEEVIYDQNADTLTAVGNVMLRDPAGNVTRSDSLTLTSDFRDGFLQSLNMTTADNTRIIAERAQRREGNVTEFQQGRFTPCRSEGGMPPLWCISAASVVHDQTAATISYQDAQFEMFGYPIVYLPYFEHADPSVKRKSGFLAPGYSNSSALGLGLEIPYYFALNPSYDLTIYPKYFSKQGLLMQADWRQRIFNGEYTIKLAGIDQGSLNYEDNGPTRANTALDHFRGSVETKGQFSLSDWWKFGWDATLESDDTFRRFYGLDSLTRTDRINTAYLIGQSDRNFFSTRLYQFRGLTSDATPQTESIVHPVVDYNYIFADPVLGGELSWKSNALSMSRADVVNHTKTQEFTRAVTELDWRRRLTDDIGISYTPFASLRGDVYRLDNYIDPRTGLAVQDETFARGLATGGMTVSYPWIARVAAASHTIEPIGQIIARQASIDQRRVPDEDARSLVFDDTNLFEPQKFSGYDRIETGTRANYGLQYTFQGANGGYARVLAGQSYHITGDNAYASPGFDSDGKPNFSTSSGLGTPRSDYVLGMYLAPAETFRLLAQSRFNEQNLDLQRQDVGASFSYGPFAASAMYTFAAANSAVGMESSQQEVSGALGIRLNDQWTLSGGVRYDLDTSTPIADMVQLRYADECFVLTATFTDSYINDPARDLIADRSIMLRFEWKYLGQLQYRTTVLDSVIPGSAGTAP